MARLLLGIDASTQSVSALVYDLDAAAIVKEVSVNFGTDLPQYGAPQGFIPGGEGGEVHSDPRMWLDGLDLCFQRLLEAEVPLAEVVAISGAGQQHGTVYLNAVGLEALEKLSGARSLAVQLDDGFARQSSPIWMDTATTAQCRAIEAALGGAAQVCARSGSIAIERFSGPQIRRFAELDPRGYANCARIHLVSSFMASILAGRDAPIDHGDGAGMNLLNLQTLDWDAALLDATAPDLRAKLPPVVPSATVLGAVAPYFVERFNVSPQAQVVAFTGDNPSSLVGMGAWRPGKVVVSLGTSDTFFAAMPQPLTDPAGWGHVFGNPCGGFMTLQCFLNGSLAREKVRDALGMDWVDFTAAIKSAPAGCDGVQLLPFFGAEISPRLADATPIWSGEGNWQDNPLAARACVEGQFLNMKLCAEWMHLQPEQVYLTGGASTNPAIAQIAADVFGVRARRLRISGSVALGGALRAGMAVDALSEEAAEAFVAQSCEADGFAPVTANSAIYTEAIERLRSLPVYAGR